MGLRNFRRPRKSLFLLNLKLTSSQDELDSSFCRCSYQSTAGSSSREGFKQISLADYKGKYLVLFFYPLDFTFVCPTEIISFSDRIDEFKALNAEVVGVSTDSHFSHLAWINLARKEGGLGGLNYPLLSGFHKNVSRDYGVLIED